MTKNMTKKKNVLIIFSDQLRAFDLGCYGSSAVETPHIDSLAEQGSMVDIGVSNNPLCTPARSCLLSGQYSRTCTGRTDNTLEEFPPFRRDVFPNKSIAEIFKDEGYHTSLIGKWHIGAHPKTVGFDNCVYPKMHHLNHNQDFCDNDKGISIVSGYAEDFNFRNLEKQLCGTDGKPFFTYYNISPPHMPFFDMPKEFIEKYSGKKIDLRPNVKRGDATPHDRHNFNIYMYDYLYYMKYFPENQYVKPFDIGEDFTVEDLYRCYYGAVAYTDYLVGRITELLKQKGIFEDTVILFSADHGDMLASHGIYNKNTLYEEAIRIPMILCNGGKVESKIGSLIDCMPTLLDACGIPVPDYVQGESLLRKRKSQEIFIENMSGLIGVRDERYLYGVQLDKTQQKIIDDEVMFFDCQKDPYQLNNLINDKSKETLKLISKYKKIIKNYHEKTEYTKMLT